MLAIKLVPGRQKSKSHSLANGWQGRLQGVKEQAQGCAAAEQQLCIILGKSLATNDRSFMVICELPIFKHLLLIFLRSGGLFLHTVLWEGVFLRQARYQRVIT